MTDGLSIIITNRNEPMLPFTIRRAKETADCPLEIIVVDDGSENPPPDMDGVQFIREPIPMGLGCGRDKGILAASNDACLILDAHMNFHHDDWASYCRDYVRQNRTHIACAVSVQLDSDPCNTEAEQMDMDRRWTDWHRGESDEPTPRAKYYGARVEMLDHKHHRPFPCKWHGEYRAAIENGTPAIIQSVLGGAYALSRFWYVEGLRRPWQENRGWGTSEQSYTIPNWLCGGESVLLPIEIGHQYRTGKQDRVPYRISERMEIQILWNRYKLVEVLPLGEFLRDRLQALMYLSSAYDRYERAAAMDSGYCAQYREFLGSQARTMADYFERFGVVDDVPDLTGQVKWRTEK